MKRNRLVTLHIIATALAVVTISTFFLSSLAAEISGDEAWIRMVKIGIFYALPLLMVVMPTLALTGNALAGRSQHPDIRRKQRRMKWIMVNGLMLIALAIFLYYRANYQAIDRTFLYAQVVELVLGFSNLTLIGLNIRTGLRLSGQFRKNHQPVSARVG